MIFAADNDNLFATMTDAGIKSRFANLHVFDRTKTATGGSDLS